MTAHPVFDADILDGVQLLEADAGTGKTWTIAGLVVRAIVERGLDLDRVLVLTFTNAAAAELADRIRLRIAQLERLLDDRLEARAGSGVVEPFCTAYAATLDETGARRARELLRVALARIDEMSVHTIHAWCQRVIDEHALSIGVARGLPIGAGDGERVVGRVHDWWRSEVLDAPAERIALFALAGVSPEAIEKSVKAMVSLPLARIAAKDCDWRALAPRAFAARAALVDAMHADAAELLAWMRVPGNVSGALKQHGANWFAALQAFCDAPLAPMSRETVERLGSRRFAKATPDCAIPGCCDALLAIDSAMQGLRASVASEIVASLRRTREADLCQASSLAFDDLLRLVHEALADPTSGPPLARALRVRHPIALVDECQDTDPLQWDIVRRIYARNDDGAAGSALVLVGDPKQAIYSFRGADVHSYLSARSGAERTHRLDENQRSHTALIEAVNALFQVGNPFRVNDIAFEPAAVGARARRAFYAADPPSVGARAPMTVVMLDAGAGAGGKPLSAPRARLQAIGATVAEIARLLASDVRYDERALQPRDIAVLVQTRAQGAFVKRALARAGIGAAEISRDSVLDTLEAAELMRVVAAVDDCADPARLRSALATTLLGLDAAAIAVLEADSAALLAVVARFVDARVRWQRHGPIASLRPLLYAFDAPARLAGLVDGERRLTNLGHLVALLAEDDAARDNPREATRAWARLRRRDAGDDDTRELRLESDENLVRILTVHKSKGLEFPVVFVPFAWSARKAQAPDPCVRHERDADGGWHTVLDLSPDQAARDAAAGEQQAEGLRTLYVALTRAEQRCYVFWGAANHCVHAPLAWLLHQADAVGGGASFALDADGVRGALAHWKMRAGLRHPGALAIVGASTLVTPTRALPAPEGRLDDSAKTLPSSDGCAPALFSPEGESALLRARDWNTAIAPATITTSFSAIASALTGGNETSTQPWHNADVVDPGRDEAAASATEAAACETQTVVPDSIRFRFPAGAQAGVCLHAILEQASFDAPIDASLVAHWLARCGYRRTDATQVGAWLDEALGVAMRAPDGVRFALSSVPRARQLRELEFQLSGRNVSQRALVDVLGDTLALDAMPALSRWSGFLRGFIDLVFEHDGRWYIVDWKSNHLGDGAQRYDQPALADAMRAHAYPLQAALYALAVHRWLRRTLRGYDYERSFGGVFYVFLRGAGLEAPADRSTQLCGVHTSRPSAHAIEALDRLFDGFSGERTP